MAFTTWTALLAKWKDALANRDTDSFFLMSSENLHEMKAVYTRLDNVAKFTEWLEGKAAMEQETDPDTGESYGTGAILLSDGGVA